MLQEQIMDEIKHIPNSKLPELYDLIYHFRLGLVHGKEIHMKKKQRPIGLAKGSFKIPACFFEPLPNEILDAFEGRGK
ncbi:MAG: hypothetical protein HQK77_16300 [Desulfobacterales bacterium]|nr:hypothetical protein [Desulfobacterales bacterium]